MNVDVILNMTMGALQRGGQFTRDLTRRVSGAVSSGAGEGLVAFSNSPKGAKAFRDLMAGGMRKAADSLEKAYTKAAREQARINHDIARVTKQITQAQSEGNQQAVERLRREKRAKEKELDKVERHTDNVIKRANKAAGERLRLMEESEERRARTTSQKLEGATQTFEKGVAAAMSADNLDLKSITEALTSGLSGGLKKGVGALGARGAGAGAMGRGLMAAMSGMAASLAVVAGAAAAFAAVAGAAYGQAKAMNKSLVEGVGAADLFTGAGKNLTTTLGDLRKMSIDVAMDLRVTKEEVMGVITSFNDAGVTLREFRGIVRGTGTDLDAMQDITRSAILASNALGISVSDVAGFFNTMNRDMGHGLDSIQGAFGMIHSEAKKAGMSTKDFFAAINGATSGMALYNFRIGDTVGLMTDLVKILGEDLAKEKISLEGTFRGMGMQDRLKATMLSGGKAGKVAKADARAQAKEFADQFKGAGVQGLGAVGGAGGIDVAKLGAMNEKEFNKLYRGIVAGTDQDTVNAKRQLVQLRDVSKSFKGGTMNIAQSLGGLSKTGEMAMQLSQGFGLIGKPISEATAFDEMILQEALGMSAEQIDVNKRLDRAFREEFQDLKAQGKTDAKTMEEALAGGDLTKGEELLKEAADFQYGLTERLGMESLKETRSISQTISNTIAMTLDKIYGVLEQMLGFTAKDSEKDIAAAGLKSRKSMDDLARAIAGIDEKIAKDKAGLDKELDPAELAIKKKQIAELENEKTRLRDLQHLEKSRQTALASGVGIQEADTMARKASFKRRYGEEGVGALSFKGLSKDDSKKMKELITVGEGTYVEKMGKRRWATGEKELKLAQVREQLSTGMMSVEQAKDRGFEVELKPLEELSSDQLTAVESIAERQKQEREKETEDITEAQSDTTKAVDKVAAALTETQRGAVAGVTKMSGKALRAAVREGRQSDIVTAAVNWAGGNKKKLQQARQALTAAGIEYGKKLSDFIYRGDSSGGTISPIDSKDAFLAMKPGGAVDQASRGGKGGGRGVVNISINGGDLAQVRKVVTDVLLKTGYDDMRSYKA